MKFWKNSKVLGIISVAIFVTQGLESRGQIVVEKPRGLSEPTPFVSNDDHIVHTLKPELPFVDAVQSKPIQKNNAWANLVSWSIIAAMLAFAGFFFWRNYQNEKNERRWKRRQSWWRLF